MGNAFIYNIASGSMTTINRPGPFTSTTAYGVYGNRIAGGFSRPGLSRAYILNQDTGATPTTTRPGGTVVTHFEGITGGGRANTYNLVADLVDGHGERRSWVVHIDENGVATWIPLNRGARAPDVDLGDNRSTADSDRRLTSRAA